jgi:hypothetical protein
MTPRKMELFNIPLKTSNSETLDTANNFRTVSKFSGVDLVEKLAHDKGVEDDGCMNDIMFCCPKGLVGGKSKNWNPLNSIQQEE